MKKQLLFLVVSVVLMFGLLFVTAVPGQEIEEISLQVSDYFPKENDDNVLAGPAFMEMDEQGHFYVSDVTLNTILKFSPSGKYLLSIGESGQGPGEFTMMYQFCIANGRIYLNDQANRRLQIMSTEGAFIDLFKVFAIPRDLAVHVGFIYTIHFDPAIRVSDPHNGNLVNVLDETGASVRRFGRYLDLAPNVSIRANDCEIRIYNDLVYIIYACYPLLRIYTLNGKLVKTIQFSGMHYKDRVLQNYDWNKLHYKNMVLPFRFLFRAFDVNDYGIFVALYDTTRLLLDQFDHQGNFVQRFTKGQPVEAYSLLDLRIRADEKGEPVFYILDADENRLPRIEVCRK